MTKRLSRQEQNLLEIHGYVNDNPRYLADCASERRAARWAEEAREKFLGKSVTVTTERFGAPFVGTCTEVKLVHMSVSLIVDTHVCYSWELKLI